jgi:5-aminopentanamidase
MRPPLVTNGCRKRQRALIRRLSGVSAYRVTVRVAAFQMRPILDDARAACAAVAAGVSWAADQGAGLAVFPETYLQGHSYDRQTIARRAHALTDPEVRGLAESLRGFPVTVVVGMFERRGNSLRNVALVLRAGAIAGVYAKVRPNENGVEAGDDMPVFEADGQRFAINICNDANDPDLARRARKGGSSVICFPLNNVLPPATAEKWRERSIGNLVVRARETRCWVVSSDVAGACGTRMSLGCTVIVSPEGDIKARVPEGTTGKIVLDLNPIWATQGHSPIVSEKAAMMRGIETSSMRSTS